ncbi:GGDEF domain-containing protein [Mesorhizobium sp. Z1-4]|uniref:GGDEF domain-containing protein n=1 Tax=Mesorhizobium sp. Z1-4 TaxID=2448478 RepID=UPI000FD73BE6|nr:GGDEF domain-containing protein [Mesorhizobium sp. Z1-4]
MSGAGFILAINLSVAGLFAAAFLVVAVYDLARVSARWFAASFAFGMLNFLLEFVVAAAAPSILLRVAAYMAFIAALAAFTRGIAHLHNRRPPWKAVLAIAFGALLLRLAIDDMARESFTRLLLFQTPYFLLQALGAAIAMRWPRPGLAGKVLAGMLLLSALHYLAKPFAAAWSGGAGRNSESYLATDYAMISQTSGTVLGVAAALLLLAILIRDVMADFTRQSMTDKLSGLPNRRSFEAYLDECMRSAAETGLPVSLVIGDLDRFKAVNDTYGHAAGDRVIVAFSQLLRDCLTDPRSAARIGGEEFAVLLAGSDLSTARLFAENVRSAFAIQEVGDMPPQTRFTASFGIAQLNPGDTAFEFQERADTALYAAKRNGRDRVEVAAPAQAQSTVQKACA